MKKCPECGYIEDNSSVPFCTYCGHPISLSIPEDQIFDENNKNIIHINKLTKNVKLSLFGFILIGIILGSSFIIFSPLSPLAPSISVVIKSVSSTPEITYNYFNTSDTTPILEYCILINFTVNFPVPKDSQGAKLPCVFGTKLDGHSNLTNSDASLKGCGDYNLPYKGSYNLVHYVTIESKNASNFHYPVTFSISILSWFLNISSKPFSVTINSSGFSTIKVSKAEFNNETNNISKTGYNISSDFFVITDHNINLATSCMHLALKKGSSYSLESASLPWNITYSCQIPAIVTIPPGVSAFSLSSQVIDPSGNLYNYSTQYILPTVFTFQITTGQNLINSPFVSVYPYANSTAS